MTNTASLPRDSSVQHTEVSACDTEFIYLSPPDVGEAERAALLRAFDSGWIAPLGPEVDAFEKEIASRCSRARAVALSSGTAALHLGLLALGVKANDYVLTSTFTFAATANAITYLGAIPYFVDSCVESGNMDPVLLDEALAECIVRGRKVGAVLPVDLLGKSAAHDEIQAVVARHEEKSGYSIPILVDSAESLGASLGGRSAGSFGNAAVFSFNGNKVMTTSGGGMLVTDDELIADRVRYLATQAREPVIHYEHTEVGYNYRMSNLLAALGRAQLARLDQMISRRKEIRNFYSQIFSPIEGVSIFGASCDREDNFWLTSIVVDQRKTGWGSDALMLWLREAGIESRPMWKPMHMQPVFAAFESRVNGVSQQLFETGLTLPSGSSMTAQQMTRISRAIGEFLELHSRQSLEGKGEAVVSDS